MGTKLRVIYAAPSVGWGGLFTPEARAREISRFRAQLDALKPAFPNVTFIEEELRSGEDFAKLDEDRVEDGLLFFNLTGGTDEAIFKALDRGLPMILFVEPYSWHVWCREALRTHPNADKLMLVSTSRFNDVAAKIKVVEAYKRLKDTKILLFANWETDDVKLIYGADSIPHYTISDMERTFGVEIKRMDLRAILDAYAEVPEAEATSVASALVAGAQWVVEPSQEEVRKAARLYLAMKAVLAAEKANGITIDCLALLHELPTTPCVGFTLLNDEGICAACEADLNSLLTMLVFRYLGDVPSFISDPVIDTARNSVIHAHCVSATRLNGTHRERYIVRNHSESRTGVSLQVKMRVGQDVTVAKFVDLNRLFISTGTILSNPDVDRGCRTKVEVAVPDAKKMLRAFAGGLHRVLAYGNHVEAIEDLCQLLGIEVISES